MDNFPEKKHPLSFIEMDKMKSILHFYLENQFGRKPMIIEDEGFAEQSMLGLGDDYFFIIEDDLYAAYSYTSKNNDVILVAINDSSEERTYNISDVTKEFYSKEETHLN